MGRSLPSELLLHILVRLAPKDLLRFMCVTRAWSLLIRDPSFAKAQLQFSNKTTNCTRSVLFLTARASDSDPRGPFHFRSSTFDDHNHTLGKAVKIDQPQVLRVCSRPVLGCHLNGLVCYHGKEHKNVVLWNPSIQKFKTIPPAILDRGRGRKWLGFGYDSTDDDYKLVRIIESYKMKLHQIYSLRTNSWKKVHNWPPSVYRFLCCRDGIVFLNGTLNLLMRDTSDCDRWIILTFDLVTEKYQELPAPVKRQGLLSKAVLRVLEDYMCFCVNHVRTQHDVWIMKEYEGATKSWTLLYSIAQASVPWTINICRPLSLSNNGKTVLLEIWPNTLAWIDLETEKVQQAQIFFYRVAMYVGSLYLLDGDPVI